MTSAYLYLYLLAALLFLLRVFLRNERLGMAASLVTYAGLLTNVTLVVWRSVRGGRLPLASGYEFSLVFVIGVVAAYVVLEVLTGQRVLGAFALPIAALIGWYGFSTFPDRQIHGLLPALQNPFWLTVHVLMAIISYGALAVGFGLSAAHLVQSGLARTRRGPSRALPSAERLDVLTYQVIGFAFPFLTLLIVTGSVWAQTAWGRWWGWDPKETASLVAWLIYAVYVHARLLAGWRGTKASLVAVLGFAAVVFTYAGVNYLGRGLHQYGG